MGKTLEIIASLIEGEEANKPVEANSNEHVGLLDIGTNFYLVRAPKEVDEDIIKKANVYSLLRNLLEDANNRKMPTQRVRIDYSYNP